uniref:Retrotransposon gag domain-containing protein n=1 Tax=Cajanus cajan TaxID=3821 RepID=A0A151R031_CAJCA|nr:hypothetical protein KK1_042968 [Cajanus cajan]
MNKLQHDNSTSNVGDISKDHLNALEERLRVVEGDNFDIQEVADMCLVQDIQFPAKFKIPDFQKYTGASCPKGHLTMYCRKMAVYVGNEKLLIHCFQESLSDVALNWYTQLDGGTIQTWKQLADAFLRRYKYNIVLIPDRSDLQSLSKKGDESFKTYAQRWKELAAQIEPSLSDKEMVTMFIDSLSGPYYDKMIGNTSTLFSDIVTIDKIAITYTELLPQLLEASMLVRLPPTKKMNPPYPPWYKPEERCDYHSKSSGHSVERCKTLQFRVQGLIDAGWLKFDTDTPSIDKHPLHKHDEE